MGVAASMSLPFDSRDRVTSHSSDTASPSTPGIVSSSTGVKLSACATCTWSPSLQAISDPPTTAFGGTLTIVASPS